jgi:hypothetical protein
MSDILETQLLQNADRAAEDLAKQSSDSNFRTDLDPARESALDDAFSTISAAAPPANDAAHGYENGGAVNPLEGAPKAAPKAAAPVEPAAAAAAEPSPAAETSTKAPRGLLDDIVAPDPSTAPAPAADPYGDVKLRSDASPKTRETFEQLKTVAKQREEAAQLRFTEAEKLRTELATKVAELEKRTAAPETAAELKELRQFRAQFDTANDPEFRQKFDSRTQENYTAIYGKLQAHGLPATEIEKLKGFSSTDRDNAIDGFLGKLPAVDRKYIEAKLLGNVNIADERERALGEARGKADEILAARKSAPVQHATQRINEVAALVQPELTRLPFIHVKPVPAGAGPEDVKRLESENATALALQEQLRNAITDDSPASRARAALSVPLARHYSQAYATEKARADALQKKLDGITSASATSRTARSSAAPAAAAPAATIHADPGDALDELFNANRG